MDQNVEIVAAKHIGRETVHYMSNIFKYFIAYGILAAWVMLGQPF